MVKNLTFTNSASGTYKDFLPVKEGQRVVLDVQNDEKKQNGDIAQIKIGEHLDKENKQFTKTVGVIAISAALFGMVLGKGPRTKYYTKMNNLLDWLREKIKNHDKISEFEKKIELMYAKIIEKLGRLNNLTTLKDSACLGLSETTIGQKLYLNKFCTFITNTSRKLSRMAAERSYEKAMIAVDNDYLKLKNLIEKLVKSKKLTEEEGNNLIQDLTGMNEKFQRNANAVNRGKRFDGIEHNTKDIGQLIRNILGQKLKNTSIKEKIQILKEVLSQNYITRAVADRKGTQGKNIIRENILQIEHGFTMNITERCNYMTHLLNDIADNMKTVTKITPKEKDKYSQQMEILYDYIKKYRISAGNTEEPEKSMEFLNQIKKAFDELKPIVNTKSTVLDNHLQKMEDAFNSYEQQGTLRKTLQFLKEKNVTTDDYEQYEKILEHMRKKVKKATENELTYYDKCAEYSVGSAPTDALGLILPIICGSYVVTTGKDKDEKIAASLKTGIPIIGGVATALYSTIIMLSNMQGIILGTLVGFGLNILGNVANREYKEIAKQKEMTQKAVAAYLKNHLG